jgi:hypothetical protein
MKSQLFVAKRFGNWYLLVGGANDDGSITRDCIERTGLSPQHLAIDVAARLAYFFGRHGLFFQGSVHAMGNLLTIYDYGWAESTEQAPGGWRKKNESEYEYFPSILSDLRLVLRQGVARIEIQGPQKYWELYLNDNSLILADFPTELEGQLHELLGVYGMQIADGGETFDAFLSEDSPLDFY